MAFCGITLETCAGGEVLDALHFMLEMAIRYQLPVKADISGVVMMVSPNVKPAEIYYQWFSEKLKENIPEGCKR